MSHRLNILNNHFKPQASAQTNLVKTSFHGKVALVELNPPTKLVFLSFPLVQAIGDELSKLEINPDVHVVVLTGKGSSFATGADINEL